MHIAFVGLPGVPFRGRACDVRVTYFANLLAASHKVTIVNWYSAISLNRYGRGELNNKVDIVNIVKSRYSKGCYSKLLSFISIIKEPYVILSLNKKMHIDVLHIYTEHLFAYFTYKFLSIIIGAKLIYNYVEDRSSFDSSSYFMRKLQRLADVVAAKYCDGVIPISDFLEKKALSINPKLKTIKILPLCDFNDFKAIHAQTQIKDPYILYCGSINYKEVIDFIIKSYRSSIISSSRKLILVLSGNQEKISQVAQKNPGIIVLSHIEYKELISFYKGAEALLIPLRNTTKDIARFPNKVCEYLASEGVIISTSIGEISRYFKDNVNAILAKDYSIKLMSEKLDDLYNGIYNIEKMKECSYNTGLKYFDINAYSQKIELYLQSLFYKS